MRPILIQLLSGPGAGRQATFTQSPITFGRDVDNLLILSDPKVSRKHGEIRLENDKWVLVNMSPAGTRVGWRKITSKPYILRDNDVLKVGDQPAYKISFGPEDSSSSDSTDSAPASLQPTKASLSKRSKLWIAIGLIWTLAIIAAVVYQTGLIGTSQTTANNPTDSPAPELTADQIRAEIIRPLPSLPQTDERAAREALKRAVELSHSLHVSQVNLYRAYHAYQEHLAALGKDTFENPLDRLRFDDLQRQLVEKVTEQYAQAYNRLKSQNFTSAAEEFNALTRLYDDPQSLIYRNAIEHQKWARANIQKR